MKRLLNVVVAIIVGVVPLLGSGGGVLAASDGVVEVVDGGQSETSAIESILVKMAEPTGMQTQSAEMGIAAIESTLSTFGVETAEPLVTLGADSSEGENFGLERWYKIDMRGMSGDADTLLKVLQASESVEYAEPDYIAEATYVPNDTRYGEQWGLDQIDIEGAWDESRGSTGTVIAVIDSGIDLGHADLRNNLWVNPGETAGNGVDDDRNGYIDDVNGWDFVGDDNDVQDEGGHGTLVAGVAAAQINNGIGIAGVAGECWIMTVKVMQTSGTANYSDMVSGIIYAADKGAQVINLSLGGYADSQILRDAVAYAISRNVTVVAGAGNDNTDDAFYPAAIEEVIAVAGTDENDEKVSTSNYGEWVDLCAPGEGILSTSLGGDYAEGSGTSMASAFVSGMAGLLLTLHPEWTPAMVELQLTHTVDDIDSLNGGYAGKLGSGRLNGGQAVVEPTPSLAYAGYKVDGVSNGRPNFGSTAEITVAVYNNWADATGVTATLSSTDPYVTVTQGTASYGDILAAETVENSSAFSISIGAGAGYNHSMPFTLRLVGNGGAYSKTVTFNIVTRSSVEAVQGTVASDTVWTNDKTYRVTGNIGVAPGVTLTIEAGTTVQFAGDYKLSVGGCLIADGTEAQPIVFEAVDEDTTWDGLYFDDTSLDTVTLDDGTYVSGNLLRYVEMSGTSSSDESMEIARSVTTTEATIYVSHCTMDSALSCTPGGTALWVLDSVISGMIQGGDNSHVVRCNSLMENVYVGVNSEVRDCEVGYIGADNDSLIDGNTLSSTTDIGDSASIGIYSIGIVTVTNNSLVAVGVIEIESGLVRGNLVASTMSNGIQIKRSDNEVSVSIENNTLLNVGGRAICLYDGSALGHITDNNFVNNAGVYDIYNGSTNAVDATGNWWGTTNTSVINSRIYDYYDDYTRGVVTYQPILTSPSAGAPAYLVSATLSPGSPVGIETGTFELTFSREMDTSVDPVVSFTNERRGTWKIDPQEFDIQADETIYIRDVLYMDDGTIWLDVEVSYGGLWADTYIVSSSDDGWVNQLEYDYLSGEIRSAPDGSIWLVAKTSTGKGIVLRYDGVAWKSYTEAIEDFLSSSSFTISSFVLGEDNKVWLAYRIGYDSDILCLDSNSSSIERLNQDIETSINGIFDFGIDAEGNLWVATDIGLYCYNGTSSVVYTAENAGLPSNDVRSIVFDEEGQAWSTFCISSSESYKVARYDGTDWTIYDASDLGIPSDSLKNFYLQVDGETIVAPQHVGSADYLILLDEDTLAWRNIEMPEGINWVGRGLALLDDGRVMVSYEDDLMTYYNSSSIIVSDGADWLDGQHYQVSYDFSSAVPRGTYKLAVSDAVGSDSLAMVSVASAMTFDVDYAGQIADTTAPSSPVVAAWSNEGSTTLLGRWSATDSDSAIDRYSYAIGTTQGGTEVVNWTYTTEAQVERMGLSLIPGHTYYISVKARNEGGLWSEVGVSNAVVAGETTSPPIVCIPLVLKNRG